MRWIWPIVKWLSFSLFALLCVGMIYQQIGAMNAVQSSQLDSTQLFTS